MAKKNSAPAPQAPAEVESLVRRLSSVEERLESLKTLKETLRSSIQEKMDENSLDKAHTVYGNVTIRKTDVYDLSSFPAVAEAMAKLEEAKIALAAAEEVARAQSEPSSQKRVLAFSRNKAVSARARKGRIYVATVLRKSQAKV